MTLAEEIVDWVEENISMTPYIHPQWHKKLREWGFKELGEAIRYLGVDNSDDEVVNRKSASNDKDVRKETKYPYPYTQAEKDYENSL